MRQTQKEASSDQAGSGISESNKDYGKYYEQTAHAIKNIAGINRWMVVLTVGLVLATWYQGCLTRQSNEESRKVFKAARQASIGLEAHNNQLMEFLQDSVNGYVVLHFKNAGEGRADKVYVQALALFGEEYKWDMPAFTLKNVENLGIPIQPGIGYDFPLTVALGDVQKVKAGQQPVSVVGRVSYKDEFGEWHCQSICINFWPSFSPFPTLCQMQHDFCDGKSHPVIAYTTSSTFGFSSGGHVLAPGSNEPHEFYIHQHYSSPTAGASPSISITTHVVP